MVLVFVLYVAFNESRHLVSRERKSAKKLKGGGGAVFD